MSCSLLEFAGFHRLRGDSLGADAIQYRRKPWVCGAALLVGLAFGLMSAVVAVPARAESGDGARVRVVLITLDTLRLDAFSVQSGRPTLERTRAWAEKGLIFERYYSATSSTQPSHATLFTGLHPWQHGVSKNGIVLDENQDTLAEALQAAGFRTAGVVASFPVHRRFGFKQGFDVYFDEFTEGEIKRWGGVKNRRRTFSSPADLVLARAEEVLEQLGGEKQFLWVHLFDPHAPYGSGEEEELAATDLGVLRAIHEGEADAGALVARARRLYDEDVRFMDRQLDGFLERMMADSDKVETHVIVVSDHGESFGEGGSMGHGKRLTAEQIHVPLFILSPRVKTGLAEQPVGTIDLPATVLALAGAPTILGESVEFLTGATPSRPVLGMRRTFSEPYDESRTDGSVHKVSGLQFYFVGDSEVYTGNSSALSVFDTERTPSDPSVAESVKKRFLSIEREYQGLEARDVEDAETLEQLRALGYVQ